MRSPHAPYPAHGSLRARLLFTALLSAASSAAQEQAPAPASAAPVPAAAPLIPVTPSAARPSEPTSAVYTMLYRHTTPAEVAVVLERVRAFMEASTSSQLVTQDGTVVTDFSAPLPQGTAPNRGGAVVFQISAYEQGVTYAGMLAVAQATGDARYNEFVAKRFDLISKWFPLIPAPPAEAAAPPAASVGALENANRGGQRGVGRRGGRGQQLRTLMAPRTLDDCGAMSAAFIKARRAGVGGDLMPLIQTDLDYILNKQFRLPDGTVARSWPIPQSLWADDMYMSVPALAQMGKLTGDNKYYDEAVKQVVQLSERLFQPDLGIYRHGWITVNPVTIDVHWARANGWCVMAMAELLDVLPENHAGRDAVLKLYRAHIHGLVERQSQYGLWHQLLDRPDTYLETSASAMFVFALAKGINRGWLSPAYGTLTLVGWNAVASRVNAEGQVEGTCMGTNFDLSLPYYYFRPTSVYALHGYGPVLLAGAEMITLLKSDKWSISTQYGSTYFVPEGLTPVRN